MIYIKEKTLPTLHLIITNNTNMFYTHAVDACKCTDGRAVQ